MSVETSGGRGDPGCMAPAVDLVPLKRVAEQSGYALGRLSKLAIAGYFPSIASGGRRRHVHRVVAESLIVLLQAGITDGPMIQAVLADPAGVAAAASQVAAVVGSGPGRCLLEVADLAKRSAQLA